ncbi:hypothetical protein ABK040_015700 [Willaertia magna]
MENHLTLDLPPEIIDIIFSFLPIHFFIELHLNCNNRKELLNGNNYFLTIMKEMMEEITKIKSNRRLSVITTDDNLLQKYVDKEGLFNIKYYELKMISRYIVKNNFILFLKNDLPIIYILQNFFNKLLINNLEICWIFNKNEIINFQNLKLQIEQQHCSFYILILQLLSENNEIINTLQQNNNYNETIRIHGLIYIKNNNNIAFDVLNIFNIKKENYLIKKVNTDQFYLLFVENNIKQYNKHEIIYQTLKKGNSNLSFELENNKKVNYYLLDSLQRVMRPNISSKILQYDWIKQFKFIFNTNNKDYYLKCNRSIRKLFLLFIPFEAILFFIFEMMVYEFGYLFTFKSTRELFFSLKDNFHKNLFTFGIDIFFCLQSLFFFSGYSNLDIVMSTFLVKLIFNCFLFITGTRELCYYFQILEWINYFVILFFFLLSFFEMKRHWPIYYSEGLLKLFWKNKLEFYSSIEFKQFVSNVVKKKQQQQRKKKSLKKWLFIGGGLLTATIAGCYYFMTSN